MNSWRVEHDYAIPIEIIKKCKQKLSYSEAVCQLVSFISYGAMKREIFTMVRKVLQLTVSNEIVNFHKI